MYQGPIFTIPILLMFLPALASAQRAPDPERAAVEEVITSLGEYFQASDRSWTPSEV